MRCEWCGRAATAERGQCTVCDRPIPPEDAAAELAWREARDRTWHSRGRGTWWRLTNKQRDLWRSGHTKLFPVPLTLREANAFVAQHHRHSKPVRGYRFAVGVEDAAGFWGVGIFGRPISRILNADRHTGEVLRVCTLDGASKGANSFLYGACWRAWRAMGGRKMVTYTLASESGASLRGAGAVIVAQLEPRDWSKERVDHLERLHQPVYDEPKLRWEWVA